MVKLQKLFARTFTVLLLALAPPLAMAQDSFVWAPDFPVGAALAEIAAPDQNGSTRTFADLVGENGLLLMFSRSFDW